MNKWMVAKAPLVLVASPAHCRQIGEETRWDGTRLELALLPVRTETSLQVFPWAGIAIWEGSLASPMSHSCAPSLPRRSAAALHSSNQMLKPNLVLL